MKSRNYSIDFMKFFCITAIVCIHLAPFSGSKLGIIINTLCRVALPLIFICSGYLFLSKFSKGHSKKYFYKMLKLFIISNILYLLLLIFINILFHNGIRSTIYYYFSNLKLTDFYYGDGMIEFHLWYLTAMVLIVPMMYFTVKYNLINKILILSGILNISGIFIYNCGHLKNNRDAIFFALFYCTLGIYLNTKEEIIKEKLNNKINYRYLLLILLFTLTSVIERFIYDYVFIKTGDIYISTIPLSILIFVLCITEIKEKDNILCKVGRKSFGIYVVHIGVINLINIFLYKVGMLQFTSTIFWQIIGTPIIMILSLISYNILIFINNKIIALIENKVTNKVYIVD
ncbi:acyltransferase family protein [Paraclostridium bifermentans]|uniref:acyltransferase family protein n=1 Tax=Paraclostridium bifermentans TaxID=1490 RepID=UPI00189D0BB0|nr:acyltransferase family protein [Paraclostridium bifermentans]